jgi:hopene-associated glycosyltransferase HpnB
METTILILALLSFVIWIILLLLRGQFWRADQRLSDTQVPLSHFPSVTVIVPARNEAEFIGTSLKSILNQNYPGMEKVILIDDGSSDGTAGIAQKTAAILNRTDKLNIIKSQSLPIGWTGKLWAMEQGIRYAQSLKVPPDYFLFTDADIEHSPHNLMELMEKSEAEQYQMVSLMVMLRCKSFWEKLLIPAFVFFFQKLYPFRWVNDPKIQFAAAAGGCILIRREALTRIGGLQILKDTLIDDCTLAQAVKGTSSTLSQNGTHTAINSGFSFVKVAFPLKSKSLNPIWLGLTEKTRSLRHYSNLSGIWSMVARTAFTQLNYSIVLLGLTLLGMILIYLIPPFGFIWGMLTGRGLITLLSALALVSMGVAYRPTLKLYLVSPIFGLALPVIGFYYCIMTLDSAVKYWQGKGGSWGGRTYHKLKGNESMPNL